MPWDPDQLFLAAEDGAWYDASDLTTLWENSDLTTQVTADGDPVGAWEDKSGNGHTLLQATSANRPLYKTSGGLHWVEFDQVNDHMTVNFGANLTQPITSGCSVRGGTIGAWNYGYIWDSLSATDRHILIYHFQNTRTIFHAGTDIYGGDLAASTDFTFSTLADGTSSFLRIDRTETQTDGGTSEFDGLTLGVRYTFGTERYLKRAYSMTWVERAITDTELRSLETYNDNARGLVDSSLDGTNLFPFMPLIIPPPEIVGY